MSFIYRTLSSNVASTPSTTILKANGVCFKDKKLSIGQAVRKQHASGQSKLCKTEGALTYGSIVLIPLWY